ncbi:unnamed protein product [Musa acuminata subsp. burmannicoides]
MIDANVRFLHMDSYLCFKMPKESYLYGKSRGRPATDTASRQRPPVVARLIFLRRETFSRRIGRGRWRCQGCPPSKRRLSRRSSSSVMIQDVNLSKFILEMKSSQEHQFAHLQRENDKFRADTENKYSELRADIKKLSNKLQLEFEKLYSELQLQVEKLY